MQENWTCTNSSSHDMYAKHTAGVELMDPNYKMGTTVPNILTTLYNPLEFVDYLYISLWSILLQCK